MATSKIQSAISSGVDNIKNVQKNLSQLPSNVTNRVNTIKDNTQKQISNSIAWAKGNLTMYHYGLIIFVIIIIIYSIDKSAKYDKKNPTLFSSPSNGRLNVSPPTSQFKTMQQKREYSYTMWLYIDNMDYNFNKYKHVFTRGNATDFKNVNKTIDETDSTGNSISIEQIAVPGIWIDKIKNNLIFKMSTVNENNLSKLVDDPPAPGTPITDRLIGEDVCILSPTNESKVVNITAPPPGDICTHADRQSSWGCDAFMIEDFPLKEWFCVGVVIKDREVDLYFNGDLTFTGSLRGPPKEEVTNQVKIAGVGDPATSGASSSTAGLQGWAGSYRNIGMYTYPLSATEMKKIFYNGPENREYYLKWLYYLTDPIMKLISSEKRKDAILAAAYIKESATSITNMNTIEIDASTAFNNTLKEKTEGLYRKGERVFYLDTAAKEKLAAYISDGPNVDPTSPDTKELTYDIILEKHNFDSTASTDNIINNVIQSKLSKDVKSSNSYAIYISIIVVIILIGIIVYYKIY